MTCVLALQATRGCLSWSLAIDGLRRFLRAQLTLGQGWYLTSSVGWFYVSFGFFLGISGILMAAVNFGALARHPIATDSDQSASSARASSLL